MAKTTFAPATVLQISPSHQIRVAAVEYEGQTKLDIRSFKRWGDSKDFMPTKAGVSIPLEQIDAFHAASGKHSKELPRRVVDMDNRVVWVIATEVTEVHFKKDAKHVYVTEEEALAMEPPDGYRIFRSTIKNGVATEAERLFLRRGGEWKRLKTKEQQRAETAAVKRKPTTATVAATRDKAKRR